MRRRPTTKQTCGAAHFVSVLPLRVLRHMVHDVAMTPTEELIGTAEAARILDKSPRTVHRLVKSGDLTPALVAQGGQAGVFLFHRSDIERLAKGRAA